MKNDDIAARMRHDMTVTLRSYGYRAHGLNDTMYEALVEALVDDAMFHIEFLSIDNQDLRDEIETLRGEHV